MGRQLFEPERYPLILLELADTPFDEVALLVQIILERTLFRLIVVLRNDSGHVFSVQSVSKPPGVVCFVGDNRFGP
jgi:hypothetical protein